jgi:hypothetical protein
MSHVVCLIADPERLPLDRAAVASLERALGATARSLAPDEACELPVDDLDAAGSGRASRPLCPPRRRTTSSYCRPRADASACW